MRLNASPLIASAAVAVTALGSFLALKGAAVSAVQPVLSHKTVPVLQKDGREFKDLNRNGKLDPYEDWRLAPQARAEDLVRRMALEDLAGVMVHATLPAVGGALASIGRGSGYDYERSKALVEGKRINTFITRLAGDPVKIAEANNQIQELAEKTPFGIPVTIGTDPRNSFLYVAGASESAGAFSKWPESTGLAAINDPALTRKFADIARREYIAVGIREALSPQADLATEPRWPRMNGTFGEDADVAKAQVQAYVEGMQDGDSGLRPSSVITVVKHWAGYGAQKDGFDSHSYYGQFAALTDAWFQYHVKPFEGAFAAHVAAVMPTYSILEHVTLDGKPLEPVGAGYSKQLLTDLLRGKYGFRGMVLSDWGITNDCGELCRNGMPAGQRATPAQIAMPWGVIDLPRQERFAKAINAGVDQVGGTDDVAALLDAAHSGKLTESRMREAATRVLEQKFAAGLFENPFVDAAEAGRIVGNAASKKAGEDAQRRAMVPLENHLSKKPVSRGMRVWLFNVSADVARRHGLTPVDTPAEAGIAIIRASAPYETLHGGYFFGAMQHEGRLNFQPGDAAYDALKQCAKTPVVMTVYLDRPAILTEVRNKVGALYADFGVSDDGLLDVLMGDATAEGHLPFELPSSMEAVRAQKSEAPHDSSKPLYPYGYALR